MADLSSDGGEIERRYDWASVSPSVAIIETIAVYQTGDPTETDDVLDAPLNRYVDGDALDALVRGNAPLNLTLAVAEYEVQITGRTVRVTFSGLAHGSPP